MAGGQERALRRRIRSIQSTKKITRAMELIAASRIVPTISGSGAASGKSGGGAAGRTGALTIVASESSSSGVMCTPTRTGVTPGQVLGDQAFCGIRATMRMLVVSSSICSQGRR